MKTKISFILILFTTMGFSQKLKIVQGDFDFLKGQKEVNVEFVYDHMTVLKDKLTNDEYVTAHSAELEEKSKGKGKTWEKSWITARELIYAPKFLELMNRDLHKGKGIYFGQELTDTPCTLIVDTIWVFPGWDAGVMKQPAKVTTLLKFVETANPSTVLAEVSSENAPGDQWGSTFNNESRLGEGYAKTGKSFAKLILKEAF